MNLLAALLALAAAALGAAVFVLSSRIRALRAALAAAESRPLPPPPPRLVESRRERFGLLWFPLLTVEDPQKTVVSVVAGLPHCARCVKPLALSSGSPEEWVCAGCGDRRAATTADIQVTDSVVADAAQEFLARHPGYRLAPGLSVSRRLPAG